MSFLNKFKKEFDGLNIGERLQAAQGPQQGHGYSVPPPPSYGYEHQPPPHNPYPSQYPPPEKQTSPQNAYPNQYPPPEHQPPPHSPYPSQYPPPEKQPSPHNPYPSQYPPPEKQSPAHSPYPPPQDPYYQGQHGYGTPSPQPHVQSPPPAPPTYPGYQQSPHQPGLTPPPASHPYPHPQHGASAPGALQVGGAPCPTPPRWVPHWSEHDRRWYYVETSGRSSWEVPAGLPPLAAMPGYSGQGGSREGHQGQAGYHGGPYALATPQVPPPKSSDSKKPSSNTMLAAAGGFAAGGVVGYFTHDVLDKRKKKKRHGKMPADFADFSEYPAMMVGLDCNICDQAISGPYAHCAKCDRGDYDLCRDCIAQGAVCDGRGKHRMVKVYPKYTCDYCDQLIRGDFYHCGVCHKGDWDVCQKCLDRGLTCKADGGHNLAKLYIPVPGLGKHSGGGGGSSSSDSD